MADEQDIFEEQPATPPKLLDAKGDPYRPLPEAARKFCFKPGQSGNPGGRTKTKPFKKAIEKYLKAKPGAAPEPENNMEIIAKNLVEMATSPGTNKKGKVSANAIRAIKEIADRIDGKAMPSPEELESAKGSKVILVNTAQADPPISGE